MTDGSELSCFRDLPGFNAARANLHPLRSALRLLDSNGLKVWVKSPWRTIVRM
jgi:hypothetical protein